MRNLQFDADAARVFLAEFAGQLQQGLAQPLFAVHGHQVGDDLLLVGNAHRKVLHKVLPQKTEERIVGGSFAALMVLFILITVVDVKRFF